MTKPRPKQVREEFYLSDISTRDKPWDVHRALADQVAELYNTPEFAPYRQRMNRCAQWLQFALRAANDGELVMKLLMAHFCRCRWCPVCQWRRTLMWIARFLQIIPRLLEEYPTARFVFLTLTVRNCEVQDLRKTLTRMSKSWERLTKRKQWPAIGFVRSVEVTRSEDGKAHPHYHCLLMVSSSYFGGNGYITQAEWTELWKSCLKVDYTPIVDVRSVKAKKIKGVIPDANLGLYQAICETLKYSVKEADLVADADWLHELTRQLHKTRAIAVGGVMREFLSEEDPEDLINSGLEDETAESEDSTLSFGWRETLKKYGKNKNR